MSLIACDLLLLNFTQDDVGALGVASARTFSGYLVVGEGFKTNGRQRENGCIEGEYVLNFVWNRSREEH